MIFNCPGSEKFKQPAADMVKCPNCGEEVEIWSDEAKAICPKCKGAVARLENQSCLDWCKFARECVGSDIYDKYMKDKKNLEKRK